MRRAAEAVLGLVPGLLLFGFSVAAGATPLPLVFEANQGQIDPRVRFLARTQEASLFLLDDGGAVLSLPGAGAESAVRMSLEGGAPQPAAVGVGEHGRTHYYRGQDPARWHTGIPTWDRARYTAVYPGIDLIYYANARRLEFDFVVAPGTDPGAIRLRFSGPETGDGQGSATPVALDGDGRLRLATPAGEVVLEAPHVYQDAAGERRTVAGRYALAGPGQVRFALGAYDPTLPLVIDPVLVYSSFLGGAAADAAGGVVVDAAGNLLVGGITQSADFPLAAPVQGTPPGGWDAFVTKLSPDGSQLIFSTFLGSAGYEPGGSVIVDPAGNVYVGGVTTGTDFPVLNALQPQLRGEADMFITKLSPTGSLVYSTYLGGSAVDSGAALAVRPDGTLYVGGYTGSTDYPLVNPVQATLYPSTCGEAPATYTCADMVLTVLSPAGDQILYSTYFGGAGYDFVGSLAVDSTGAIYVLSPVRAADLPLVNPFQSQYGGGISDFFIMKIRPDGTPPIYATLLGGSSTDWPAGITVDGEGNAYVSGYCSSPELPVPYAIQPVPGGIDWYLAKINARGTGVEFATFLGGPGFDNPGGPALDPLGNLVISGRVVDADFPVLDSLQPPTGVEGVVAKIHATGPTLLYATYLGGSSVDFAYGASMDSQGDVYIGGNTDSEDFPLVNPFQAEYGGHGHRSDYAEGFVARLSDGKPTLATPSRIPAQPGSTVTVPVRFTPGGLAISSTVLSLDYDEACLTFNPVDGNADGIPDAVTFHTPAGFLRSVSFNAADTDGEIDLALVDLAPPFTALPLGKLADVTFQVKPGCGGTAQSTLARVGFSAAPPVSFGRTNGQSVAGLSLDGSIQVWGGLRGDCNGDQAVDAGDLSASALELFDTDGSFWLDAVYSSFAGSPAGCDSNADGAIDAGDLSCSILLLFEGPGACSTSSLVTGIRNGFAEDPEAPRLEIPAQASPGRGGQVLLPVTFRRGTLPVNSLAFSLFIPDSLELDPADADEDGIPDAVKLNLPEGFLGQVRWTPENRAGQLALLVMDASGARRELPPLDRLATIRLTPKNGAPATGVRFGSAPAASFGLNGGRSTQGETRIVGQE